MTEDDGTKLKPEDAHSRALDHAWAWFKYHAEQRIALIRFYIVAIGGMAAGIGILQQQGQYALCAIVSFFAALAAFCFIRLDQRSSDLVKQAKEALYHEQDWLMKQANNNKWERNSRKPSKPILNFKWLPYTYGDNIELILYTGALLFVVMSGHSLLAHH
jgi:hypothetical protein